MCLQKICFLLIAAYRFIRRDYQNHNLPVKPHPNECFAAIVLVLLMRDSKKTYE